VSQKSYAAEDTDLKPAYLYQRISSKSKSGRTKSVVSLVDGPVEIGGDDIYFVVLQSTFEKVQKHSSCHDAKRSIKWSITC